MGSTVLICVAEAQADYMLQFINRWQTENIHSFSPKVEATEDFVQHTEKIMRTTVWTDNCRSWYKNNSASGRVSVLWPGSSLHYIEAIREARFDDFEIKYRGNRFAWMGNGYSQTELDDTCDWSYYIREKDDSPFASRRKRREVLTKNGTVLNRAPGAFFKLD